MSNAGTDLAYNTSYTLNWHTPGKVLQLTLSGDYPVEEAQEVNDVILSVLTKTNSPHFLLIDATQMTRPRNFKAIRAVQNYMDHRQLKHIYVVTTDNLVKLAMMVIFNLSRATLHMSNDTMRANRMMARHLNNMP